MMGNLSYSAKGAQSAPSNPHQSQKHRKTSRGINEHLLAEVTLPVQRMAMKHQVKQSECVCMNMKRMVQLKLAYNIF
jgi:hypothetical protein